MASLQIDFQDLLLNEENPRISKAGSQREALQRIIEDQDIKLVVLAESIVADGLNPMDRWLVIKSPNKNKYVVLEGNRRFATIKILHNATILDDLEVRAPVKRRLETLATQFELQMINPIDCFEVDKQEDAAAWLSQRQTGENKGRGIVNWGGVATARFRGRDPALQALDLVIAHGSLTEEEKDLVEDHFPITTLDRLLSTPAVREKIGVEVINAKLATDLPPTEIIKPLRKIVLDLANEAINVTRLKSKEQQIAYVSKLGKDLPDISKRSGKFNRVDGLADQDFKPPSPKPKPKRTPKIAEIVKELRSLGLAEYPHSISVLFRVFLETSVDHYLTKAGISLQVNTNGGPKDKNLRGKVKSAIDQMVKNGTPKKDLAGVSKGVDDKNSPIFIDTLHNYVHNRFLSPTERELKVAWDNTQIFFEKIWK